MQRQNQYTAHIPTSNKYVHLHQCTERVKHAYALTVTHIHVYTQTHASNDSETNTSDRAKGATTQLRCVRATLCEICPTDIIVPGCTHTHRHCCTAAVYSAASLKSLLLQRIRVAGTAHRFSFAIYRCVHCIFPALRMHSLCRGGRIGVARPNVRGATFEWRMLLY